jgi:hypothetical protein
LMMMIYGDGWMEVDWDGMGLGRDTHTDTHEVWLG